MAGDFRVILPFNYVNGTTADANEVNANEHEVRDKYNNSLHGTSGHTHSGADGDGPKINSTGLDLLANYAWLGQHSWSNSNNHAYRFHGAGDTYASSSILSLTCDNTAAATFNYFRCVADYNGVPDLRAYLASDGSLFLKQSAKLYLDFSNVAISSPSAGVMKFESGGNEFMRSNANGEILLTSVNPPTANYMNRHSTVKGWIKATTGPGAGVITVIDSYNVSSATENGIGATLRINWNTDFSNANYVPSIVVQANDGGGNFYGGVIQITSQTTSVLEIIAASNDGTANGAVTNAAQWWVMVVGDQ